MRLVSAASARSLVTCVTTYGPPPHKRESGQSLLRHVISMSLPPAIDRPASAFSRIPSASLRFVPSLFTRFRLRVLCVELPSSVTRYSLSRDHGHAAAGTFVPLHAAPL